MKRRKPRVCLVLWHRVQANTRTNTHKTGACLLYNTIDHPSQNLTPLAALPRDFMRSDRACWISTFLNRRWQRQREFSRAVYAQPARLSPDEKIPARGRDRRRELHG